MQMQRHSTLNKLRDLVAVTEQTQTREAGRKRKSPPHKIHQITRAYTKWTSDAIRMAPLRSGRYQPPQNLHDIVLQPPLQHYPKSNLLADTHQLILELLHTELRRFQQIYTDASKQHDRSVGAAVFLKEQNTSIIKRLLNPFSIFSAEAAAVLAALNYIRAQKLHGQCLICTDSKSLLATIVNPQ